MGRLAGTLGVDVVDERGCVLGDLLRANALCKSSGRCRRYVLDTTKYTRPSGIWGRAPSKISPGDFYQLPSILIKSSTKCRDH